MRKIRVYRILHCDELGPVNLTKTQGVSNGPLEPVITWLPGVPDPHKDSKGFDEFLKKYHAIHNGSTEKELIEDQKKCYWCNAIFKRSDGGWSFIGHDHDDMSKYLCPDCSQYWNPDTYSHPCPCMCDGDLRRCVYSK